MRFRNDVFASFRLNGTKIPLRPDSGADETVCEAAGLTVRLLHRWYSPQLLEVRVDLANNSDTRSGQITELYGLDAAFDTTGDLTWEGLAGDNCSADSFLPEKQPFGERSWNVWEAEGGRSSGTKGFPYFDLTDGESSVVVGVGWTGNWRFTVEKDGSVTGISVTKSLSPECDNEALRVLRKMPKLQSVLQNV